MAEPPSTLKSRRTTLEVALSVITEIRSGEGINALLMTLNIFLQLSAYYLIKPVQKALFLQSFGAEHESYMSAAIAVSLLLIVPTYARLINRFPPTRVVVGVTLFFASHLVLFYGASHIDAARSFLGLAFYVWVGVFSMMIMAQFWAFANDLYTGEQGKRVFALLGVGASLGAVCGSQLTTLLVGSLGEQSVYLLLLPSAGLLFLCACISHVVCRRMRGSAIRPTATSAPRPAIASAKRQRTSSAFQMVFKHRYLRLIAALSLVFTVVNTNGEYLLSRLIVDSAIAAREAGTLGGLTTAAFVGLAFARFFFWVNVLGVILQTFVVSRLVKFGGVRMTLLFLPTIALFGAVAFLAFPVLAVLKFAKTAENASDYSVNNTVRHILWLPTTTEMKYQAKQAVDTFFVRMGDVCSAVLVFVFVDFLQLGPRMMAISSAALVSVWLLLALGIARENRLLTAPPRVPEDSGNPRERISAS